MPLMQAGLHCIEWVELSAKAKGFDWSKSQRIKRVRERLLQAVRRLGN